MITKTNYQFDETKTDSSEALLNAAFDLIFEEIKKDPEGGLYENSVQLSKSSDVRKSKAVNCIKNLER